MRSQHSKDRSPQQRSRHRAALCCAWAVTALAVAGAADGGEPFFFAGKPIHPACIHAITMRQGDVTPVTTAVNLDGCARSRRVGRPPRSEDGLLLLQDEALLQGGSFGYRVLHQLDNGIYGLVVERVLPDGEKLVSMAAVEMVERPMIRRGDLIRVQQLELVGELWIPETRSLRFEAVGNRVHYSAGVGPDRVEDVVDFTRIGKVRR